MNTLLTHLCLALGLLSASTLHAETPLEGAKEMHALLEVKDYKTLFTTRYSEWHKVTKDGMKPEDAIAKLSKAFEKRHELMLSLYAQLAEGDYEISEYENAEHAQPSETGRIATTIVTLRGREVPYRLYEMKNGKWGFHL